MVKKLLILLLAAIPMFLFSIGVPAAEEMSNDVSSTSTAAAVGPITIHELREAIARKGARWEAEENHLSRLPMEKKRRMVGVQLPQLQSHHMVLAPAASTSEPSGAAGSGALPATLDWRNYNGGNYVTPIKDQGDCGSCWAFGSTAAFESSKLVARQTPGAPIDEAEQVLVSCVPMGNCDGGYVEVASDFMRDTGLPPESFYPYTATNGNCSSGPLSGWRSNTQKITSWAWVTANRPAPGDLKAALAAHGPLVTIFAVYDDFFNYSSGIYARTSGDFVGYHAVAIVGYDDIEQAFIVKNSWGTGWGEQGFFRISYSQINDTIRFGYWAIAYVSPDSPACAFAISSSGTTIGFNGGSGPAVNVTASSQTCPWTATSSVNWITITSGASGSGNGTVQYSVQPNSGTQQRTGTLKMAGRDYSVTQEGQSCAYAISPANVAVDATGAPGKITVSTQAGCPWTATSSASWVSVTSGATGSGSGFVMYAIGVNQQSTPRNGIVMVAGKSFTVNQTAGPVYDLTYTRAGRGTGSVFINGIEYTDSVKLSFPANSIVTFSAKPGYDCTFDGWLLNGSSAGNGTVRARMFGPMSMIATFNLILHPATCVLSISVNGPGVANASPGGPCAGSTCTSNLPYDTVVTFSASPQKGYRFLGWGGACSGNGTCKIRMNEAKSVTAYFGR